MGGCFFFLQEGEGKGQDTAVAIHLYRKNCILFVTNCFFEFLGWDTEQNKKGSTCGAGGQRPCRCSTAPWWGHRKWRL